VSWWSSNGSIGNRELTTVAIMVARMAVTSRLSRSWPETSASDEVERATTTRRLTLRASNLTCRYTHRL